MPIQLEDELVRAFRSPELPGHAPPVVDRLDRRSPEIGTKAFERPGAHQKPRARSPETFFRRNPSAERELGGAERKIHRVAEDRRVGSSYRARVDDGCDALRDRSPPGLEPASSEVAPVIRQRARSPRSAFRASVDFEEAVAHSVARVDG